MARLDFLWQLQARDEKLDMEALQGFNRSEIMDMDKDESTKKHSFNGRFNIWSSALRPDLCRSWRSLYF